MSIYEHRGRVDLCKYYLRPVKDYQSRFLETGWANTYF